MQLSVAHNILMIGPPGAGKTLLARALPAILPRMTIDEAHCDAVARHPLLYAR